MTSYVKHIQKTAKQSTAQAGGKPLHITKRSLVLLWDHPEGHNKINYYYKSELHIAMDQQPGP